jgi:hypothetical protein
MKGSQSHRVLKCVENATTLVLGGRCGLCVVITGTADRTVTVINSCGLRYVWQCTEVIANLWSLCDDRKRFHWFSLGEKEDYTVTD